MRLFDEEHSRRQICSFSGDLSQFAGVRQMELCDGVERGLRILEFRTGTGLRFTVIIDRCMDIGDCEYNGMAIGWNSSAGFRHPAMHTYESEDGLSFMRSFSGLMMTCGLDHILGPYKADAAEYNYPGKQTTQHAIHGRVGFLPAKLTGYGERWDGDRCFLWAEGVIRQSAVFAEDLELTRRIEIEVGTDEIQINDEVRNRGFNITPHMYCYHINVGYPVLADTSRYLAPIADVIWAAHEEKYQDQGVGYNTLAAPSDDFREQVWQHEMHPDQYGEVPVAIVNDKLGFGFEVTTLKNQFPCFYEWQHLQSGGYAFGIEPSTNHVLGNEFARNRDELIRLSHGDTRRYSVKLRVLKSAEDIANCEKRIRNIQAQPAEPYPKLSGHFPSLKEYRK